VALHSSELYALDMLSPMSWRVWMLGVGAVYGSWPIHKQH